MSSYNELIKNFEKIRAYMREFYVYGFKSRNEYDKKSARSYDDERRRMESWLGDHMGFVRTPEGKNMFISIDSRVSVHNPFYKAWKAKSFTDGDVTLHFLLFDILYSPEIVLTLPEILQRIDEALRCFDTPMMFDESTVRKKLKEYMAEGIIAGEKQGRSMVYRRAGAADDFFAPVDTDALHFYSEIAPCGVIGSFLLDKQRDHEDHLAFKHHYITGALDSDVLAMLFEAMHRKCEITAVNFARHSSGQKEVCVVPLRVFISVQSGRQHLLAYQPASGQIKPFRIDFLSDVRIGEVRPDFDALRAKLDASQPFMWGVNCKKSNRHLEHVEFTVQVNRGEEHIIQRLYREKRVGTVEKVDDTHYRFYAEVYDTSELIPWIRTFICRITRLNFSDRTAENRFKKDMETMYRMYGIEPADGGETL